ncbi:hypothetical protein [Spirulina major]|uniref:hypothetical protein n=1 Tax=Spirulina major TaxID=270636 RepID=UPI001114B080|nr:hypothetical protein [Spirulina major]
MASNRETLSSITQIQELSSTAIATYKRILYELTTIMVYFSIVKRYIEVVYPCYSSSVKEDSGKTIIQVSPSFFSDSSQIQKTIFLCENLDDSRFYKFIVKCFLIHKNQSRVKITFNERGGGGHTISQEFKKIRDSNPKQLGICIVDSDKFFPKSKLGNTACTIKKEWRPEHDLHVYLCVLKSREIENLIPCQIFFDYISKQQGDKDRESFLKFLKFVKDQNISDIKMFIDIKCGTKLFDIFESKEKQWISKILKLQGASFTALDENCLSASRCLKNQSKACSCLICPRFGEHTMANIINYIDNESNHKIYQSCKAELVQDGVINEEWEDIGQLILDWCIATEGKIT